MSGMEDTSLYVFAEDFGTSYFKYGPIYIQKPEMIENRGYFPKILKSMAKVRGYEEKEVIVGEDVTKYLESKRELSRLYYPMRKGVIERGDVRGWKVVEALIRHALNAFKPDRSRPEFQGFEGFYIVASLASHSPTYMYENLFEIHRKIEAESGLIKAVSIIPQPLAVAIAQEATVCTVLECGHGNTQIAPISRDIIRPALIPLNRGGSDSNAIARQILKDLGYSDLAREEKMVTLFKEAAGLIPVNLNKAIEWVRVNPERISNSFKIPGTDIEINMGNKAWLRFLIGEYMFNPGHEIFESYYTRGFLPPSDTVLSETVIPGTIRISEAIKMSIQMCAVEVQSQLFKRIILSGGGFAWKVPVKLKDVAVDSTVKIREMLREDGIENANVEIVKNPLYSVWRGCLIYGAALPRDYGWSWKTMDGWMYFK